MLIHGKQGVVNANKPSEYIAQSNRTKVTHLDAISQISSIHPRIITTSGFAMGSTRDSVVKRDEIVIVCQPLVPEMIL